MLKKSELYLIDKGFGPGDAITMTVRDIREVFIRRYSHLHWGLIKCDLFGGRKC